MTIVESRADSGLCLLVLEALGQMRDSFPGLESDSVLSLPPVLFLPGCAIAVGM